MDSFELNKIAGALLATLAFAVGLSILTEGIYSAEAPAKPAYAIQVASQQQQQTPQPVAQADPPVGEVLAKADPKRGEQAFRPCVTCHSTGKGEPAKMGPNLWDVFGGKMAHMAGFSYSPAFQSAANEGKTWTAAALYTYLADPRAYVPNNKMAFPGLKKAQDRADVIAYLRSLSDDPKPLQ